MRTPLLVASIVVMTPFAGAAAQAVAPGAQAAFVAQCRQDYVARDASNARWADAQCAEDWKKVVAAGLAAAALIGALPAAGERPDVASLRTRMAGVRWGARPPAGSLAQGQLGNLVARIGGQAAPADIGFQWSATGAEIPLDIVGALRARGVTLDMASCEKTGAGEGMRSFAGSLPGRAPFTLRINQRTAPTAGALSYYGVTVPLNGRHPPRGNRAGCDFL